MNSNGCIRNPWGYPYPPQIPYPPQRPYPPPFGPIFY